MGAFRPIGTVKEYDPRADGAIFSTGDERGVLRFLDEEIVRIQMTRA